MPQQAGTAVFAGGCFWCAEAVFDSLRGVISVEPGYTGGKLKNPTYEQVCSGTTGHTEAIMIEFDPSSISYKDLLEVFFSTHDPTTKDRQGDDVGPQYRSVIFSVDSDQKKIAAELIENLRMRQVFSAPILTEIRPLEDFYPAEAYHRLYYKNNSGLPYCQLVINPKLAKLRQKFSKLLK